MKTVRKAASLLSAALLACASLPLGAQEYPTRPVRLVIAWPPGGITDVISRALAAVLSESMGQQFVPDNRPGAAGTLGVGIAAKAQPDGYTLLMTDVPSHAISASLYTKLPYDPVKDVEPVYLAARSPLVLVVSPKLGVKTIAQLIEHAKARPNQLSFASSGPGSITHLTAERFKSETGVTLLHVPYKGGAPATAAVVSGESGLYFACIAAAIPHIKAGRLMLLGVTASKRSPVFPDAPAVAEALPGFEMGCDTGLFAPGGTPRALIARLNAAAMKAAEQPKMKDVLATNSAESGHYTPAEFRKHVAAEMRDWGKVVRAAGLKVD
jgi:tripartite-type tricarboxylate transporter receptor subunit TctC